MSKNSQKDIIKSYNKRWGLKSGEDHHVTDVRKKKDFPDSVEIGDTWEDTDGTTYKKIGDDAWVVESKRERFSISECQHCGKYMKSPNEKNVYLQTGKCLTCHAKEETKKIGRGEEYKPPKWKSQILFKDSFGNVVMDVNDMIKEYGNVVTHGVLTSVYKNMSEMNEEKRNNVLYESIAKKMEEIEEEEGGEIDHEEVREQMASAKKKLSKRTNEELKKNI